MVISWQILSTIYKIITTEIRAQMMVRCKDLRRKMISMNNSTIWCLQDQVTISYHQETLQGTGKITIPSKMLRTTEFKTSKIKDCNKNSRTIIGYLWEEVTTLEIRNWVMFWKEVLWIKIWQHSRRFWDTETRIRVAILKEMIWKCQLYQKDTIKIFQHNGVQF